MTTVAPPQEHLLTPALYALLTDQSFQCPPHIALLDDWFVKAATSPTGLKIAITLPPQHGKTTLVSRKGPAWYISRFPHKRIILTSYQSDYAAEHGQVVRDDVNEHGRVFPGRPFVSQQRAARYDWQLAGYDGGMKSAGVGGAITGRGGDLLIIDDPVKNDKQAQSPTYRRDTWNWFRATLRTRQRPGASIFLLMTRWHEDDLYGRIKNFAEEEGEEWIFVEIPAIAGEDDPLGRAPGEALWPERYDIKHLEGERKALGTYWFEALYQGNPRPPEGNLFERSMFRYWSAKRHKRAGRIFDLDGKKIAETLLTKFAIMDPATSEKETADWTVATLWGWSKSGDLLLLDLVRERVDGAKLPGWAESVYRKWRVPFHVEREKASLGVIGRMRRKRIPVTGIRADKDKFTRATLAAAFYEEGRVWHPGRRMWVQEYEDELLAFPTGTHDDQVDNASYAARRVSGWVDLMPNNEPDDGGRGDDDGPMGGIDYGMEM
jgi:predicted phage terminase large subunit-like protein